MGQEQLNEKTGSTYVIDAESAEEMARLIRQDHLLNQHMGGLFPELSDLSHVQRVLDIACGPGGWALEAAFHYTDMKVTGIDISERMIAYANAQTHIRKCDNATFRVMDALKPLDFADASFDLINARLIAGFMHATMWPALLAECRRLLRPGGIVRITEFEWGMTNKPHFERILAVFNQTVQRAGHNFSPNGLHYGILPVLPRLLQNAGFATIEKVPYIIDLSTDPAARDGYYHDLAGIFQGFEAFIAKIPILPLAEWRELAQKALAEMHEEDFCCLFLLLTVWGYEPG